MWSHRTVRSAAAFVILIAAGCQADRTSQGDGDRPHLAQSGSMGETGDKAASGMTLTATLLGPTGEKLVPPTPDGAIDADEAIVQVDVKGIDLIDPAKTGEKPAPGQGHLHYRVDRQPVIATTATKLSFHELGPGPHTIEVMLAANDHSPLGPMATLRVNSGEAPKRTTGAETMTKNNPGAAQNATLKAHLVDKDAKAVKRAATVEVDVMGIQLGEPEAAGKESFAAVAHLHYRVDQGVVIATTEKKLSFHDLEIGPHTITVALAAQDHTLLGPKETLELNVPDSASAGH
ncbi:MAG TPA: hypothetical protein VNM87_04355 [Candidatus Udaeobacter sp.]|nr:hypothetical protein [Candidatus Udaeobacter sp.]